MGQSQISLRCPVCGQALLAAPDLDALVSCPRCRSEGPLRAIVPLDAPLPVRVQSPMPPPVATAPPPSVAEASSRAPSAPYQPRLPSPVLSDRSSAPWIGVPAPSLGSQLAVRPASSPEPPTPAAGDIARQSAALAQAASDRFAQGMGVFSRLDEVVDGRRMSILGVIAGVVLVGSKMEIVWVTTIGLTLFLLATWGMAAAWTWSIRDEDGVWTWSNALAAVWTKLRAGADGLVAFFPPTGQDLLRAGARTAFAIGLLATVGSGLLERIHLVTGIWEIGEHARTAADVAGTSLLIAAALGGWLFYLVFDANKKLRAVVRSPGGADVGPRVLDLSRNAADVYKMPPALQDVGKALASWKPRRFSDEAGYATDLRRHLTRTLGGPAVLREVWIRDATGRLVGRIDLVIGDCIAIELKRGFRGTQADRAVGQVLKYLENWQKGPVLLVVCETDGEFEGGSETARVVEATGRRALVLAAGPVAR